MGIGGFIPSFENEETVGEPKVVSFPVGKTGFGTADALPEGKFVSSKPAQVIDLQSHRQVDQLKNIRERKALDRENRILAEKRVSRLNELKRLFSDDELKLKGLKEIEVLEGLLENHAMDSLQGQTLQYKKSMIAVYYGLPLEYVQADANSSSIESLNLSIKSLSRVVAQLPADEADTRIQAKRLEELKSLKTALYVEMNNADKVLRTRKSLMTVFNGVARFIRGNKRSN